MNKYGHDLHETVHKKPGEKTPPTPTPDPEPEPGPKALPPPADDPTSPDREPFSEDLGEITSRYPVRRAATYPAKHLEMVAYQMASKTLPSSRRGKTYTWAPAKNGNGNGNGKGSARKTSKSGAARHETQPQPHEHGRLHDAGSETGQLTVSLLETGLKGMCLLLVDVSLLLFSAWQFGKSIFSAWWILNSQHLTPDTWLPFTRLLIAVL